MNMTNLMVLILSKLQTFHFTMLRIIANMKKDGLPLEMFHIHLLATTMVVVTKSKTCIATMKSFVV